jgi:hypothetical protein
MLVFSLEREQEWNPDKHVETILGRVEGGDVTVACWEPGQISPYHCHPEATEIYFPEHEVEVTPGSFVVHPPGELHEYVNGDERTLLFRVRYGSDMAARFFDWRGHAGWTQSATDAAYFQNHGGEEIVKNNPMQRRDP